MARYQLQNRYQDSGWDNLTEHCYDDLRQAIDKAAELSKDSICYGMVRVLYTSTGQIVATFPAGGLLPGMVEMGYPYGMQPRTAPVVPPVVPVELSGAIAEDAGATKYPDGLKGLLLRIADML